MIEYTISFYLDKRHTKEENSDLFPVKLRVYSYLTKKAKLYSTNMNLSETDFDSILKSSETIRGNKREIQLYLIELELRAVNAAKSLSVFTFSAFELKLFRKSDSATNVLHHYKERIETLKDNNQVATANNYENSLNSLGMFLLNKVEFAGLKQKEQEIEAVLKNLTFYDVTANWLTKYENFMVKKQGKSYTTVSMYLRALRTIFNEAISQMDIKEDIYPFGRGKVQYQIPNSRKKKKALSRSQISLLFNSEPINNEESLTKDFWFLSYALYGMNFKDICLLKFENLTSETIVYYREKTRTTTKGNLQEITVPLNDYAKKIIKRYSKNGHVKNSDYVFNIISNGDDAFEQKRKVKNFISHVNLYFNKYAKRLGFEFKISTYWARHSFATISIQKGASMELISEALNHSNLNVTKDYFAGFDDDTKKEFSNTLMDF